MTDIERWPAPEPDEDDRSAEALHTAICWALLRHGRLDDDDNDNTMVADAIVAEVYNTGETTDLILVEGSWALGAFESPEPSRKDQPARDFFRDAWSEFWTSGCVMAIVWVVVILLVAAAIFLAAWGLSSVDFNNG